MNQKSIVLALAEACLAADVTLSSAALTKLYVLSKQNANEVIECVLCFLKDTGPGKLSNAQNKRFLQLLDRICSESIIDRVSKSVHLELFEFCFRMLNKLDQACNIETLFELEQPLSDLIVALTRPDTETSTPQTVLDHLIGSGLSFTSINAKCRIRTIGLILRRNIETLPQLIGKAMDALFELISSVRNDDQRQMMAFAFNCIAESIIEHFPDSSNQSVRIEFAGRDHTDQLNSVCDAVLCRWLPNVRTDRAKEQCIACIGNLCSLISIDKFDELNAQLVQTLIGQYHHRPSNGTSPLFGVIASVTTNTTERNRSESFTSILDSSTNDRHAEFDNFYVSQALCQVFTVALNRNNTLLPQLRPKQQLSKVDNLIGVLYNQLSITYQLKEQRSHAHNELLRCFTTLAAFHFNRIIDLILHKLDSVGHTLDHEKLASLALLRQLIISASDQFPDKLLVVMKSLTKFFNDSNLEVRRSLIQVIVALAHQRHMVNDSAKSLLRFLILQCDYNISLGDLNSSTKLYADQAIFDQDALKQMAEQVLHLLSTTIDDIESVLWPLLFECLLDPLYSKGYEAICKALCALAEKLTSESSKSERIGLPLQEPSSSETFDVESTNRVLLVTRENVLARFFILIKNEACAPYCIRLVQIFCDELHPAIKPIWNQVSEAFTTSLDSSHSWDRTWFTTGCEMIFKKIDDNNFAEHFITALILQLPSYDHLLWYKEFAIEMLAQSTRCVGSKTFCVQVLEEVCAQVQHSNASEQLATAQLFGACSERYLDAVILKLEALFKQTVTPGGFLNSIFHPFRHQNSGNNVTQLRATLLMSYGFCVINGESGLTRIRVESSILSCLLKEYERYKEHEEIQMAFLQSVRNIAETAVSGRFGSSNCIRSRAQLIYQTIRIAQRDTINAKLIPMAVKTLTYLVQIEPPLTRTEKEKLMHELIAISQRQTDFDELQLQLSDLVTKILLSDASSSCESLHEIILQINQHWIGLADKSKQVRFLQLQQRILANFADSLSNDQFQRFEQFPALIALFFPLCEHAQPIIQQIALECIAQLLAIGDHLQSRDVELDSSFKEIKRLIDQIELNVQDQSIGQQVLLILIPRLRTEHHNPTPILNSLLKSLVQEQLVDARITIATMYRQLLNDFVSTLKADCPILLQQLIESVSIAQCDTLERSLLDCVHSLCSNHFKIAFKHFDQLPNPFDEQTEKFFFQLGSHGKLSALAIPYIVSLDEDDEDAIKVNLIATGDSGKRRMSRHGAADRHVFFMTSHQQMNRLLMLQQLLANHKCNSLVQEHYEYIVWYLLLHWAYSRPRANNSHSGNNGNGNDTDNSVSGKQMTIRSTFARLFTCTNQTRLLELLELTEKPQLFYGENGLGELVRRLVHALFVYQPPVLSRLFRIAIKCTQHESQLHRLTAALLLRSLAVDQTRNRSGAPLLESLLEPLLNEMLQLATDSSIEIRKIAFESIGSFAHLDQAMVADSLNTVQSVLINGLDEKQDLNEELKTICLQGICNILQRFDFELGQEKLITFVLRLRVLFNEPNILRSLSIRLFGILMSKKTVYALLENESRNALIPLILFVHDPRSANSDSAVFALRETLIHDERKEVKEFVDKYLTLKNKINYNEFCFAISKLLLNIYEELSTDFVEALLQYLGGSTAVHRQCDAILFLSHLIAADIASNSIHSATKIKVTASLIKLIGESNISEIRVKAVEAISF